MGEYLKLEDLEVYKIARELSRESWQIYLSLAMDIKIIMGQQFLKAIDSICANISEGYGRYHFLEKVRFFYIARASLFESINWLELFRERGVLEDKQFNEMKDKLDILHIKLNNYIKYNLDRKNSNHQ